VDTDTSCAKTAELIEMLFGMWTRVGGPKAPSVSWEPRSLKEKGQFGGGVGASLQCSLSSKFLGHFYLTVTVADMVVITR